MKEIDKNILRKAQSKMLDILIEVDRVCKKNNIKYWLDSGTLLGAIRHGGFIPWDDDIDIAMLEEDYNKFLQVAPRDLDINHYFLQDKRTDPNAALNSAKVRDRNSVFIDESEDGQEKYHKGIYIDVFPMSYLKNINKFTFRFFSIITKTKDLNPYAGNHRKQKLVLKYLGVIWLAKILAHFFFSKKKTTIVGYKNLYNKTYVINDIFPLSEIDFENYIFLCPYNSKEYLKSLYGDYMKLPPENERVWHSKDIKLKEKCEFEKELERTGRKLYENLDGKEK